MGWKVGSFSLYNLLALTSQRILECYALQLLFYTHSPYLKRHRHYTWKCIYLQDISELSNSAIKCNLGIYLNTPFTAVLLYSQYFVYGLWGPEAVLQESNLTRRRWLIAHFSDFLSDELNVCFLVKSHQNPFLFNIHLRCSAQFHSTVLLYLGEGRLAAMV